jgi:hypothetical protein
MRQKPFNNVREFIENRDKCVFCQAPLTFRLTNYVLNLKPTHPIGKIPVLCSKLDGNFCEFKFAYVAPSIQIKATGHLDIDTNILSFDVDSCSNYEGRSAGDFDMVEIFEGFKPYLELSCKTKYCKTNYYLASSILSCIPHISKNNHLKVPRFLLFYEACDVDKYWVQNHFIDECTYIFSKSNPNSDPMKISQLNFEEFDKIKLQKRIQTLVTFS